MTPSRARSSPWPSQWPPRSSVISSPPEQPKHFAPEKRLAFLSDGQKGQERANSTPIVSKSRRYSPTDRPRSSSRSATKPHQPTYRTGSRGTQSQNRRPEFLWWIRYLYAHHTQPWADTTTPAGKMIMTVFGGIAEFERSLILTRTQEGREAAQARGVAFGRPSKLREDQKEVVRDLVKNGQSIAAVARTFNVHPATIYRCLDQEQAL